MEPAERKSPAIQALRIFGDIRFWLVIVFLVRMVGITDPPLENTHSWRQAFTNMVARNLAEGPFDLLNPRTDLAGERTAIVASEFPGFNALIALCYRAFGPAHWYGRLIALVLSTLGAWAFHAVLLRRYGKRIAFLSTFVLLWSAWFVYGRKSMPDTFSIALVLMALYAVDKALADRMWAWLLLAIPLAALGGLCKIPAIVLCAYWGLLVLDRGLPIRGRIILALSLAMAMAPVFWWYFHWQPYLLSTYGNQLYFPYGLREGFVDLLPHMGKALERFRFSALMSHLAFGAVLWGLWRSVHTRDHRTLWVVLGVAVPFGYFILKTGSVFALHAYYILPLVPLLALLAGIGLSTLPKGTFTGLALLLVAAEAMGLRWSDLTGGAERVYLLRAEALADRYSGGSDLVATTSGLDPRPMYYLHRHGWNLDREQVTDARTLDSLGALGLRAVFVERAACDAPLPWTLLYEHADWRVYGPGLSPNNVSISHDLSSVRGKNSTTGVDFTQQFGCDGGRHLCLTQMDVVQ